MQVKYLQMHKTIIQFYGFWTLVLSFCLDFGQLSYPNTPYPCWSMTLVFVPTNHSLLFLDFGQLLYLTSHTPYLC